MSRRQEFFEKAIRGLAAQGWQRSMNADGA